VALARAVDLEAFYVPVNEDCYGRTLSHACAGVWLGEKALLVDPAYSWFGVPHRKIEALNDCQTLVIALAGLARRGDTSTSDDLQRAQIANKLTPNWEWSRSYLIGALMGDERWAVAKQMVGASPKFKNECDY